MNKKITNTNNFNYKQSSSVKKKLGSVTSRKLSVMLRKISVVNKLKLGNVNRNKKKNTLIIKDKKIKKKE